MLPPQRFGCDDHRLRINCDKPSELSKALPKKTPDASILATIEIENDGQATVRFWWKSLSAEREAHAEENGKKPKPNPAQEDPEVLQEGALAMGGHSDQDKKARALVRDEHGLTASGLQVIRSQRRDLLRAILLKDAGVGGTLARDYLTFAQLRQELGDDSSSKTGLPRFVVSYTQADSEPVDEVRPYCEDQLAAQYWKSAVEDLLGRPFMILDDVPEAFEAYLALDEGTKAQAAAVLAGLKVVRSCNARGYQIPLHDKIAEVAGADAAQIRRFWQPDQSFVSLFPKLKRMELCVGFVDRPSRASLSVKPD